MRLSTPPDLLPSEAWGTRRAALRADLRLSSALAASRLYADGRKGENYPSDAARYPDPLTEIEVYRLTKPDYSSTLTAGTTAASRTTAGGCCAAAIARVRCRASGWI